MKVKEGIIRLRNKKNSQRHYKKQLFGTSKKEALLSSQKDLVRPRKTSAVHDLKKSIFRS